MRLDARHLEDATAIDSPRSVAVRFGACSGDPTDGDAFRHVSSFDGRGLIMDDVPAGPASPEPRRPSLSVVVPVRNGGRDFERCLQRLRDSILTDFELIVVDDGSTDDSAVLALRAGATVVADPDAARPGGGTKPGGSGGQRPARSSFSTPTSRFTRRPSGGRWPGSRPTQASRPSSARTTMRRPPRDSSASIATCFIISCTSRAIFTQGIRPAHTFWTGCGMIRREVFLEFGGFDPRLYPRPAIEDIELGYRLTRAGHRIVLARDVLATHHEAVDAARDGPDRHLPTRRALDAPDQAYRNGRDRPQRQAGPEGLRGPDRRDSACRTPLHRGPLGGIGISIGLVAIVALNRGFFVFLARRKGTVFAAAALPLHLVYYCCCGLSVVIAKLTGTCGAAATTSIRPIRSERTDLAGASIPPPAGAGGLRRLPRWRKRSRYAGESPDGRVQDARLLMRIGIDGSCLSNRRGFGRFARQLLEALSPAASRAPIHRLRRSAFGGRG